MKKAYVKPSMESEAFLPQDYIAACYIVNCNVGSFDELWLESNGVPGLQRRRGGSWGNQYEADTKIVEGNLVGCNKYHKGVTKDPVANGYIYSSGWWGGSRTEEVFAWQENLGSAYDWHASLMNMHDWETNPNAS